MVMSRLTPEEQEGDREEWDKCSPWRDEHTRKPGVEGKAHGETEMNCGWILGCRLGLKGKAQKGSRSEMDRHREKRF
jgi:hypothetical protein